MKLLSVYRLRLMDGLALMVMLACISLVSGHAETAQQPKPQPRQSVAITVPASTSHETPVRTWQKSMGRAAGKEAGCFHVTYPSRKWERIACQSSSGLPFTLLGKSPTSFKPQAVGTPSGSISWAEGSFPSVSGVTSEVGITQAGKSQGNNIFSIQLNSNSDFQTPACNNHKGCTGWVQFIYNTVSGAFIEYWLLNYGLTCPAGWSPQGDNVPNCLQNQGFSQPPGVPPKISITDLQNISMQATANEGGDDTVSVFLNESSIGSFSASDSILHLAGKWTGADFNIMGIGDGATAKFNDGVTIVTALTFANQTSTAPKCNLTATTTGENNSLQPVAPCCPSAGAAPQISWTQSNVPGALSQCSCTLSTFCPFYQNQPPTYTFQCPAPVDFYSASGQTNLSTPTGLVSLARNTQQNTGSTTNEAVSVAACAPGTTNQCEIRSIDVAQSQWCLTNTPPPKPAPPSCRVCIETGRQCVIVNGRPTCRGLPQ